jgi:large subunit ribosomal protein L9
MDVILRKDIEELGTRGQVVKVEPGYARNFLLPRKLAVPATESNKKVVEQERRAFLRKEAKLASEASQLAKLLTGAAVVIRRKASGNDQLFGSVTVQDISDGLANQGYTIERKKIRLADPIKRIGSYQVPIMLHRDVVVEITVNVEREWRLTDQERSLMEGRYHALVDQKYAAQLTADEQSELLALRQRLDQLDEQFFEAAGFAESK